MTKSSESKSDITDIMRPKSRYYRHVFYYMKWVNCISMLVGGYGVYYYYGEFQLFGLVVGLILLEHCILWCLMKNEDSQWEKYHEWLANYYRREKENV